MSPNTSTEIDVPVTVGGGGRTPDPERARVGCPDAFDSTVKVPVFTPVSAGLKLIPIEQLEPGTTGAVQLLATKNDVLPVPLTAALETTKSALPEFETEIDSEELASTIT
jgi:hypothetical protein